LEEFDAAHPTVATAVNNAIAGDVFHNDADGRSIARHPGFRLVATANTLGTGATTRFNGRMKLDGATLDRFRMGRVYVGLDTALERAVFERIAGI
jgi:cobaltochelatase CobS